MGLNYEAVILEELVSAYQREWLWNITVICGPRASGVHIRQTNRVHGITITCTGKVNKFCGSLDFI